MDLLGSGAEVRPLCDENNGRLSLYTRLKSGHPTNPGSDTYSSFPLSTLPLFLSSIREAAGLSAHVAGMVREVAGLSAHAAGMVREVAGQSAPVAGAIREAAVLAAQIAGAIRKAAEVSAPVAGVIREAAGLAAQA